MRRLLPLLSLAAAACAVGPDYHATPTPMPAAWSAPRENGLTDRPADTANWWKSFGDPTLDSLVQQAVEANPDLKIAEAHLEQARAIRAMSGANLAPVVGASGSYAKERISKNQPLFGALPLPPNFPFEYSVYQAGFDASWEVDIFGGKHRAREAATADWQAAIEARNDVLVSLTAEVARTYLELRGTQRRLEIARENLRLQQQAVELTRARFECGVTNEIDLTRAAGLLAGLQAQIPPLETAARQAMAALAALLGREPGALVEELAAVPNGPPPGGRRPPEIPVGLPSDLLRRRPDVRRAERQLAAETARIGVAKSDWFPKLSLTGDAGMEATSVQKWFEPGSLFWSLGPSLQWRALDFGRVKAEVQAQNAVQAAALAGYEKTVITALQEAENALVAYAQEQNRREALGRQRALDQRGLDMANGLYADGQANFLTVLDAERSLYQTEDAQAASETSVDVDLVALYKALGGGWER